MSGLVLVPVDGGAAVQLPPGETVLGRGPLLGVSDKRVSRRHALLENLSGRLRIKPVHVNPCFLQSSLSDDPRPLDRDAWCPLQDGDLLSLLPGHLTYRVESGGGAEASPRNGQQEEDPGHRAPEAEPAGPMGTQRGQTPPPEEEAPSSQEEAGPHRPLKQEVWTAPQEVAGAGGDEAQRKRRVLPAWMMKSVEPSSSRQTGLSSVNSKTQAKQATPPYSPQEAEPSEEKEEPLRKRRKKVAASLRRRGDSEVSEESMEEGGGGGGGACGPSTTPTPEVSKSKQAEPVAGNGGSAPSAHRGSAPSPHGGSASSAHRGSAPSSHGGPTPSARRRTPCPYGKDCYRKNPLHFLELSHPGDSDHEEEESEEEGAELPECPYGTHCYRKNPLHRKEYKHSKRPARSTRTAAEKTPDPEDEYDDSFIDDDSEDGGEDSDYAPPPSDDSDQEDRKRLQREAQVFLRRRK